jgi:hypothetical protein
MTGATRRGPLDLIGGGPCDLPPYRRLAACHGRRRPAIHDFHVWSGASWLVRARTMTNGPGPRVSP